MDGQSLVSGDVADVADVSLLSLLQLDDAAFGPALRRLRQEADRPDEVLSGFDSAV